MSFSFQLEHVARIDSTNSELLRRAALGSVHGSALSADAQSAGRGQRGRRWYASKGDSLLLSVAWEFPTQHRLEGLSLAVGVALARAIQPFTRERLTLKWPNDVLLEDRAKLAGILVETLSTPHNTRAAIIGVGVNIRPPLPGDGSTIAADSLPAASLASNVLSHTTDGAALIGNALRQAVLQELDNALTRFASDGFSAFHEEWWALRAFAHTQVRVANLDSPSQIGNAMIGRIHKINTDGALVLDDGAALHTLHSGAISLRPLS